MAYTHTSLTSARIWLAEKLGDTSLVFWTGNELDRYIQEAIRILNCLTGFHRTRTSFTTVANQAIYDLTTTSGPTTHLSHTVTGSEAMLQLSYHLLEPASSGTTWNGGPMFPSAAAAQALIRRRNMFLVDTLCYLKHTTIAATTPLTDGRVSGLDQDYAYFHRLAWKDANGKYTQMWPEDELVATASRRNWNTPSDPPYAWSVVASPQLSLQLIPHIATSGTLDVIVLETSSNLGSVLGIPDDYLWAVKYGAMADLLMHEGPARDPDRAEWCAEMYQLGVRLASKHPCVLSAEISGQPLIMSNLHSLDASRAGWQGKPAATPDAIASAGLNLIALAYPPRSSTVTVELDIVAKATVPTVSSAENLQVREDQLGAVLQWAAHIALLKCSGAEFKASSIGGRRLFEIADRYTSQQISNSQYLAEMYGLQTSGDNWKPYSRTGEQVQNFSTTKEQALIERLRDSNG
jgi:hypothetical protein